MKCRLIVSCICAILGMGMAVLFYPNAPEGVRMAIAMLVSINALIVLGDGEWNG